MTRPRKPEVTRVGHCDLYWQFKEGSARVDLAHCRADVGDARGFHWWQCARRGVEEVEEVERFMFCKQHAKKARG